VKPLFIGRFQPVHLGHLSAMEWISRQDNVDRLIVGIGSSNQSFTFRNPFTAGERIEMITEVLEDMGIKFSVCTIPDTGGLASIWFSYVRNYCPSFDLIYSNDEFTRIALSYWKIPVFNTPLFNKDRLSGSNIRMLMALGKDDWVTLVPEPVRDFISRVNGVERVRKLAIIEGVLKGNP